MHVLNHKGKYLSVRGPLNIARPVQGWPVIVQAGASDDGRQLAAETAEAVFHRGSSLSDGQKLYATSRSHADKPAVTRPPEDIAGRVRRGRRQRGRGKEKGQNSTHGLHYDSAIASLSVQLGTDGVRLRSDGQLPPIPETNASKSGGNAWSMSPARDKLTVRQLAQRVGGYGGLAVCRHARCHRRPDGGMADELGCDGFNIMFPFLPAGWTISSTEWCRNCRGADLQARI